jgi:hypothetical protein
MKTTKTASIALCLTAVALAGCGGDTPADETAAQTPPPATITVPAAIFVSTAPENVLPLIDVKSAANPGDQVTFEARVGGRRDTFVENRAIFFVADPSLLSCDQLHGDSCKTPWDYCCEPSDNLLRHMATVRVVDGAGQPLELSLLDAHGLAPLKTIVVTGTVDQIDDSGNFVVDAEAIHIREG